MKAIRLSARIITGLVFIFSGTVKGIDPMGSAYKFHDYFQAFHLSFLNDLCLSLAIMLCTVEFLAGFSVLTGIKYRAGVWLTFLLMLIFTPLTLILAITNPVSDCGCFGDAVHLSNWQTFGKNIVLLAATIVLIRGLRPASNEGNKAAGWGILLAVMVVFILFNFYNLRYLPVVDFLPYKTGVKIADKMVIPEGAPADIYNSTFIYEKNGIRKEFTLANYPANDSTWKFIDQKSVLVKKGYHPPIHDFTIVSLDGEDLTQKILNDSGYVVLMVSEKLGEARMRNLTAGFEFGRFCVSKGIDFYILTASGTDEARKIDNGLQLCTADATTLKTMIRANPGYILLRQGTIAGKWSGSNLPDKEWFADKVEQNITR